MFYPMNQYKSYLKYCSNRRTSSKKGSKNRINEQKIEYRIEKNRSLAV